MFENCGLSESDSRQKGFRGRSFGCFAYPLSHYWWRILLCKIDICRMMKRGHDYVHVGRPLDAYIYLDRVFLKGLAQGNGAYSIISKAAHCISNDQTY